jgi:predicted amidohydrolase
MENLRITTVQADLHWENVEANLASISQKLEGLVGSTDLVLLPEMFTTGFSMNCAALAEPMDGKTVEWLREQAQWLGAVVTGSFIAAENGRFFNRLVWMRPDGGFDVYDKRHLFTLGNEHLHFTAGRQKLVTTWKGWKICPLICYDLRFPVWSRNTEGYDLLLYVANWPERRNHHWKQLLAARAIENQAYVAGVNRVGTDGNGLYHSGDTTVLDFSGKLLYQVSDAEDVFTARLSKEKLDAYRNDLPFIHDRDHFEFFFTGKA